MKYMILFCSLLVLSACNSDLKPFASDGCSSFPDGTFTQNELWLDCCVVHDQAYWQGGSYTQKLLADEALKSCVAKVGQPEIANLMLVGVAVGGSAYLPTPYRWAYGWSYPRGYKALTETEAARVKAFGITNDNARESISNR